MTGHDLPVFRQMFEDLWHSGLSRTPQRDKLESVLATYFQALESYPLGAVKAAYEHLQRTAEAWPPVAKWVQAMRSNPTSGLPLMDWRQVKDSDEAERLFYEGPLCHCEDCAEASVTHLPLRYVPCLDADGHVIPMQHPKRNRPVLLGEWIHGYRLKRWYAAKAAFYQQLADLKPKPMPAVRAVEPEPVDG